MNKKRHICCECFLMEIRRTAQCSFVYAVVYRCCSLECRCNIDVNSLERWSRAKTGHSSTCTLLHVLYQFNILVLVVKKIEYFFISETKTILNVLHLMRTAGGHTAQVIYTINLWLQLDTILTQLLKISTALTVLAGQNC